MTEILVALLEFFFDIIFVILFALVPLTAAFIFGYLRGEDIAYAEKCELCEAGYELEQSYADYGREVYNFVKNMRELEKMEVEVADVWRNDGFPQDPDGIC